MRVLQCRVRRLILSQASPKTAPYKAFELKTNSGHRFHRLRQRRASLFQPPHLKIHQSQVCTDSAATLAPTPPPFCKGFQCSLQIPMLPRKSFPKPSKLGRIVRVVHLIAERVRFFARAACSRFSAHNPVAAGSQHSPPARTSSERRSAFRASSSRPSFPVHLSQTDTARRRIPRCRLDCFVSAMSQLQQKFLFWKYANPR